MKIKIDQEKCIGCGSCEFNCPEVFELKNGKACLRENARLDKNKKCIDSAINNCPVAAIEKQED